VSDKITMDGGELCARSLALAGVRDVFVLHGGHLDPIFQACMDQGIRLVDMRHEAAAGHAADAYARQRGRVGVCMATAGPGFTNVLTALAQARLDCTPMLVIIGAPPLRDVERWPLQGGFDQIDMARPVTKWAMQATRTELIPFLLAQAMREAVSGAPGPVLLEIPIDVLFSRVGEALLSDTGMRTHPLTPMTDSNLVRVLAAQTRRPVGLLPHAVIAQGAAAVAAKLVALAAAGSRHVIADSIDDAQLELLGAAVAANWLATGGSGLAAGMARSLRPQSHAAAAASDDWPRGPAAILAGSCSTATLAQIERVKDELPALQLDPLALAREGNAGAAALDWARARLGERPLLIYASALPAQVAAAQAVLGRERAAQVVEHALRTIAVGLAAAGVRRFVVAGGETSGAVVEALGVRALAIGPEVAPGVPWTRAADGKPYALVLKSGNFGGPDFFTRAFEVAP